MYAGEASAKVPRCSSACQGLVVFPAPEVPVRSTVRIGAALCDGAKTVHETWIEVEVFPRIAAGSAGGSARGRDSILSPRSRMVVLGCRDGQAARLAHGLGFPSAFGGRLGPRDVILVDDMAAFGQRRHELQNAVEHGGLAVLLEIPTGDHRVAGTTVRCRPTGMGEFFFVSRATGHSLVEGLHPRDFFLWYDPASDSIMPLLRTTVEAEGWETVLASTDLSWAGGAREAAACVQKPVGAGLLRICQVRLADLLINPVAELFARRLVSKEAPRGSA